MQIKKRGFARYVNILVFLLFACLCFGCQKESGKNQGNSASDVATGGAVTGTAVTGGMITPDDGTDTYIADETELETKSREYAEQIASGLYGAVTEAFSDGLAGVLSEEQVQAYWESVTDGLAEYQGLEKIENFDRDGYRVVEVTFRYQDNQGRLLRFVYEEDGKIAGLWFYPVTLSASGTAGEVADSDAAAPGSMDFTEQALTVGRTPYTLDGKLTLPTGTDKAPVVILLSAGDAMDMDGTIGQSGNTPLQDLAEGLARQGIASLRYHRRGYQYASSMPEQAGIYETLLEDAWYAIDQMYNAREIDSSRIYVAAMGKAADYLPALIERKAGRLSGAILMGARPLRATEQFYGEAPQTVDCDARYFMDENSTLPLLVLQGEADFETPVSYYEAWQELLKGRSHIAYRSYKNLNHYFLPTRQQKDATDYDGSAVMGTAPIADIASWCQQGEK
ncbi:MAG: DUF3887 domain-containing protein [Lachnospiraceae bacterium]|nr:DUF3887 domain-containing protein [Lachnospiraceae bacterium]